MAQRKLAWRIHRLPNEDELKKSQQRAHAGAVLAIISLVLTGAPLCWLIPQARLAWLLWGITRETNQRELFFFCLWMIFSVGALLVAAIWSFFKNWLLSIRIDNELFHQ